MMAVILQVNYTPATIEDSRTQEEKLAAAEKISALPGFQWKFWIYNDAEKLKGGIYLFDDEKSAKAWGDQARINIAKRGGTDISIRVLHIDAPLSAANKAPFPFAIEA
jgi:hypothetical protein